MTILVSLIVFGVLIFVHELGHFITAKAMGVKVNEFALGMGPAILKFGKKETKYSVRLLPVGGYCKMEGEDEESSDERAFNKKPVWRRTLVIVAGAIMNLLLGFTILLIIISSNKEIATTTISKFAENAVSSQHLQVGDKIVSVDGTRIYVANDLLFTFYRGKDEFFDIEVIRDGKKIKLEGVTFPTKIEEDNTKSMRLDFAVKTVRTTFWGALSTSAKNTISIARMIWLSLIDLLTGNAGLKEMSGPVGVVGAIGQAANTNIFELLVLVAFISINLGVFNLLPVPALDGGRLLFLAIEAVRRKPIKPEYEGVVHLVGFALLILLMITVTYNDINRLITGG